MVDVLLFFFFWSDSYNLQYNFKIEKYNSVKLGKIVRQSLITKLVVALGYNLN